MNSMHSLDDAINEVVDPWMSKEENHLEFYLQASASNIDRSITAPRVTDVQKIQPAVALR